DPLGPFPGGVSSPVRAYGAVGGDPPELVRGKGCRVWDSAGREYVDYVCAYGPLILGHGHPAVLEAVAAASAAGGPFGVTTEGEIRLGTLIRERMPSIERLRFVSSGTEAVMSALRVARAATGRNLILKFEGCYHGHSDSLLVKAGSGLAGAAASSSAGVSENVAGETLLAPLDDEDAVRNIFAEHGKDIAAVILEPLPAN